MIEVLRPGALTTVQDLGRPGYAALGVPHSGALDQPALRLANLLVGNPPGTAGLETTLTGCRLRCAVPVWMAVTGALARITVAGQEVPFGAAFPVPAGAVVTVGTAQRGVRGYLAVGGGIAVAPVLGSRSTDLLAGLGPPPLRAGDRLPLGPAPAQPAAAQPSPAQPAPAQPSPAQPSPAQPSPAWPDPAQLAAGPVAAAQPAPGRPAEVRDSDAGSGIRLRIRFGPRADWFRSEAREVLLDNDFTVSPTSNRVGVRLAGPVLERSRGGELPSEGIVLGSVQVPADGQPLIFLADHPTTGGYPVLAVVHPDDLSLLAQARPGSTVGFRGSQR